MALFLQGKFWNFSENVDSDIWNFQMKGHLHVTSHSKTDDLRVPVLWEQHNPKWSSLSIGLWRLKVTTKVCKEKNTLLALVPHWHFLLAAIMGEEMEHT